MKNGFNFTEDILSEMTPEHIEELKRKYLTPKILKLFEDPQVLDFCVGFFENNLNACVTSKKMFMHRNTLSYRLLKIEKETGYNLKKFEDAFIFKIILNLYSNRV